MGNVNSLYLILFIICLGLSALFCSAETAFISVQKLRLQHLVHTGHPNAKIVANLLEKPEKFLATVLLAINFFETAVATLGTLIAVSLWGENLGAALATIIITILTLVIAEFIPKSIAARYGERIALSYAKPVLFVSLILSPFVYVLNHIGISFTNLFGESADARPTISQEEFRTAITMSRAEGTVEKDTADMLHNVFDFSNGLVREIMVPRPDVVFIEHGSTVADFLEIYVISPLSRFPVYQGTRDNVIGILSIKDVLMAEAKGEIDKRSVIDSLVRPAYFTPETKPIDELFAEMRDENQHMVVVVDEFGGTAGIVSLSQLIEEIVGPISGEMNGVEKEYEVLNEYTFQVDGSMHIQEANEVMGLGLPEGAYETVAGFVLHLLRRIPQQGEQIRYKGFKLVITKMRGVKIEEVLITKEKPKTALKESAEKASEEKHTPSES